MYEKWCYLKMVEVEPTASILDKQELYKYSNLRMREINISGHKRVKQTNGNDF